MFVCVIAERHRKVWGLTSTAAADPFTRGPLFFSAFNWPTLSTLFGHKGKIERKKNLLCSDKKKKFKKKNFQYILFFRSQHVI